MARWETVMESPRSGISSTGDPVIKSTGDGIAIVDPIERKRYRLATNEPVEVNDTTETGIPYPVDSEAEITTKTLTLPTQNSVYAYDKTGLMLVESNPKGTTSLSKGEYYLDISGSVKLYAGINSSVDIHSNADRTRINFGASTSVALGARSYHTQPAGSIRTTTDIGDVMQTVSAFSSALKTTKPERSYPTLRGHPPIIELDQELTIPSQFDPPETGISIEIPPELRSIFVVTPLAYYLGAKVKPGSVPRLVIGSECSLSLSDEDGFESTVERLLKQTVFLDCLVRAAGPSSNPLQERHELESTLQFDIKTVYNQSPIERLRSYLEVPFNVIESYLPDWKESRLSPTEDKIPYLPFLANDLAVVKTEAIRSGDFGRSSKTKAGSYSESQSSLNESIEQRWNDDSLSSIAARTPLTAFYNDINRTVRTGPIDIEVICNDPRMSEEFVALYGTYGNREDIPFEVTTRYDLTVSELATVFERTSDFVHYIGHTEEEGFRCVNGYLDAWSLETVGTDAFLLNSCRSYDQGLALLQGGSIGGIATFEDIDNVDAVQTGSAIAQLLNQGFPLYAATNIIREKSAVGESYRLLGKGSTAISQCRAGLPVRFSITQEGDQHKFRLKVYTKDEVRIGSTYQPHLNSTDAYHLIPKEIGPIPVEKSDFPKITEMSEAAILLDDEVRKGDDVTFKEIGILP